MTHQFKFGDLVLWDINPAPFIFMGESKIDPDLAWIRADNDLPYHAPFDELRPFPQPKSFPHLDTVRLDWLAKNDCALTERLCDEDGDLLDTPFAVIQKQEEHFEVLAAACDIREAIDAAIRHCAVKGQEKE